MNFNKNINIHLLVIFLLLTVSSIFAQTNFQDEIQKFQGTRNNINQTAMIVLGTWAAGNILLGTYGNFSSKGQTKYFHQFNALWNTVNLGIAIFGYLGAVNSDPSVMTNVEILDDFNSLQRFLLLNAGLDLAYITAGFYLKERAKNSSKIDRLTGYGNSLLLQGGFLLLFDIALYFIHQNNASLHLYPNLEHLMTGGIGLGLNLKL